MKDIEKIKSEDLACQVADANPANFAIEQEVAALVGATVPQPTEPSADDARELPAQLLVFLRRALLPIQTALRTALAAIYAHLDSRCTDYTPAAYDPFRLPAGPYDPMRPFVPRTLPNLLTALTAFADRKISGVPEAADGVSLMHLIADRTAAALVTEITDNNTGWSYDNTNDVINTLLNTFPNLGEITIGASYLNKKRLSSGTSRAAKIYLDCEDFDNWDRGDNTHYIGTYLSGGCPNFEVYFRKLKRHHMTVQTGWGLFRAGKLYFPVVESLTFALGGHASYNNIVTYYVYLACTGAKTDTIMVYCFSGYTGTMDIELRDGTCQNISISTFTGLTAENMYNHILLRLKQDEAGCGDGVTITLGTTNIAKLEAVDEYNTKLTELEDTYGYTFA